MNPFWWMLLVLAAFVAGTAYGMRAMGRLLQPRMRAAREESE
jgi:hypothetical protein